jgi:hypothetical protein
LHRIPVMQAAKCKHASVLDANFNLGHEILSRRKSDDYTTASTTRWSLSGKHSTAVELSPMGTLFQRCMLFDVGKNLEGKAIHKLICYILRCRQRAGLHMLLGLSWICFRYVICVPGGHQHGQINGCEIVCA